MCRYDSLERHGIGNELESIKEYFCADRACVLLSRAGREATERGHERQCKCFKVNGLREELRSKAVQGMSWARLGREASWKL